MSKNITRAIAQQFVSDYFKEDDLNRNFNYFASLPEEDVKCFIKIKSPLHLSGLHFFFESFNYLLSKEIDYEKFLSYEGLSCEEGMLLPDFVLPFNVALTGERIALNLLQLSSSITTYTKKFVEKAEDKKIKILDTRKTTPGLRAIQKYAVTVGGGFNHRFGQADLWMIKDNHKSFFGGLEGSKQFFDKIHSMYTPVLAEIHDLQELEQGISLGIKHFMLDNFSPEQVKSAILKKSDDLTYEVSGGINMDNIDSYLIDGVDAISIGGLTYAAPPVDISFKYVRV